MFLITTADQRFWKKDGKVLFLGEWCKIYGQKSVWSSRDYEVLPYHWDDRKKLHQDFIYLEEVYERYLSILSGQLNEIHGVDHSTRYWRILIGPWLLHFIEIFHDRYLSICSAIETKKVTHTWLSTLEPYAYVPNNFETFQNWYLTDEYNHYLYGRLICSLKEISYEVKNEPPRLVPVESKVFSFNFLKNGLKSFLEFYGRCIPDRLNRVVFVSSYLQKWDLLLLQKALGQVPNVCSPRIVDVVSAVDEGLRERLGSPQLRDPFESLLGEMIPLQIPTVYLEGFADMRERSLDAFPKQPELIYTTNALYADEGFKFWAATQVDKGVKLVTSQHGGHYGSALWSSNESHEIKVADRYLTWGWKGEAQQKLILLPSAQLAGVQRKIKVNPGGGILWTVMSLPRYSYWMYSLPSGPHLAIYLKHQEEFARAVSPEVHDLLTLRLFPQEYGWDEDKRWKDLDPLLKVYREKKTMYQQLCESRLSVSTYNSTTFLETFAANFPTLIFWDPEYFELRESARPYYEDLRRVGILHDSPESAAAKVNEIYLDPISWWMSAEVQESKNRFCSCFARTSRNWISEWKEELLKIVGE